MHKPAFPFFLLRKYIKIGRQQMYLLPPVILRTAELYSSEQSKESFMASEVFP